MNRSWYARLLALVAAGCSPSRPATHEFDGAAAFQYLRSQVQFGPRIPNTGPHEQCGAWILSHLRTTADTVIVQAFTARTAKGQQLQLHNYFARFSPQAPERVPYLAHWDTRDRKSTRLNSSHRT